MTTMTGYSSLLFVLLCLYNLSFSDALNGGFSVELIHRDSQKSPFYNPSETQFQRIANALHRSNIHVNHLNKSFVSQNTPQVPVTTAFGEYLMSYSIGTPPVQLYGLLDTASEISWLQCQPCTNCYKQATPIFDPSKSSTYKTIPCTSNVCKSTTGTSCPSPTSNCKYDLRDADGTSSRGDLSEDTLTFASSNGSPVHFPGIAIGCGHSNLLSFPGGNSGVVALGRGPVSLINQLRSSIGGKFSHCFVPAVSQSTVSSKFNFGDAAVVSGPGAVSTPLYAQNRETFYYVHLEAFSVGSKRIEYKSTVVTPGGNGNIILASSSPVTYLPYPYYIQLEAAIASGIKAERTKDPNNVLSLCYKAKKLDVPVMTAHFTGADVILYGLNTFIPVTDDVQCFAFASHSLAIYGNFAQQNILVGYDLQKNTVTFKHADCTKQ